MSQVRKSERWVLRSRIAGLCSLGIAYVLSGNTSAATGTPAQKGPTVHLAVVSSPGVQIASADVGQHDFGIVSLRD